MKVYGSGDPGLHSKISKALMSSLTISQELFVHDIMNLWTIFILL